MFESNLETLTKNGVEPAQQEENDGEFGAYSDKFEKNGVEPAQPGFWKIIFGNFWANPERFQLHGLSRLNPIL